MPAQAQLDFSPPYPSRIPGHHGRDTELEAAAAQLPDYSERMRAVYEFVRSRGEWGATYPEIQHALFPSAQQRLSDLVKDGHVIDSGKRRRSPRGRPCTVWRVADV